MTEEIQSIISVMIGLLVTFPFFINRVIKGKSWKKKFIEEASKQNCFTKATCVDTKIAYGSGEDGHSDSVKYNSIKVKYAYHVNGNTYYKKLTFVSQGTVAINYPYEITVYYKKNNPKKAIAKEEEKNSGCLMGIIIFFVIVFIVTNLLKIIT